MKIVTPFKVISVKFQRHYPGYLYRRELIDWSEFDGTVKPSEMVNCYSTDTGHWIGDAREARNLCKRHGLRQIQKRKPSHCVASIGFNEAQQKWYGWSHRAIVAFGIGDKVFEEDFGDENTPFVKHGKTRIRNMKQAKKAAAAFAAYVS